MDRPGLAEYSYLHALPQAVIALDADYCVHYLNPAAEALLGVSAAHLARHAFSPWPLFDTALRARCARVLESGEAASIYEQRLRVPHHADIAANIHITPVFADALPGKYPMPMQVLMTMEALDPMRRLSHEAAKNEAARGAGLMAAMLAHEVKNPLSSIRGAAQLLSEEAGAEHQPLAELICLEADRIRDLVSQMEVFDANAPVPLQPVNIHEVLQYAIAVAKAGFARRVAFVEQYDPSLPEVAGQRDLLVQLFLNLIKNAAEALEEKEKPVITLATSYRSLYLARSERRQPVMVSVTDNGSGIAESLRAQVFTPFMSSKAEGRGLGLAVVAKIAGDLGAAVELADSAGHGATFHVMLPLFA